MKRPRMPESALSRAIGQTERNTISRFIGGVVWSFRAMSVCRAAKARLDTSGVVYAVFTPVSIFLVRGNIELAEMVLSGRFAWSEMLRGFTTDCPREDRARTTERVEPATPVFMPSTTERDGTTEMACQSLLPQSGGKPCGPDSRHRPISGKPIAHLA